MTTSETCPTCGGGEGDGVHGKWHVMLLHLINAINGDKGARTQEIGIEASYRLALATVEFCDPLPLSAVIRLIPDGYRWSVGKNAGPQPLTQDLFRASCWPVEHQGPPPVSYDKTPELALAAALDAAPAQVSRLPRSAR
jgi:hypothetical protein